MIRLTKIDQLAKLPFQHNNVALFNIQMHNPVISDKSEGLKNVYYQINFSLNWDRV